MKNLIYILILTNFIYSAGGIIVFNDGTTIEGDIKSVNNNYASLTPMGLTFSEEVRMENIDSLKLYDGTTLVAGGQVKLFYENGQFIQPQNYGSNNLLEEDDYDVEYVIIPNWSLNLYTGYPVFKAASFEEFDESNAIIGVSVGSPFGIFTGDFFMNVIAEFLYYNFQQKNDLDGQSFGGPAFQLGISPGLFIGETSISMTACTGFYQNDKSKLTTGFIFGGSIDIPLGNFLGDYLEMDSDNVPIELRITSRSNLISKDKGTTGWLDGGVSIGYEF
mgnify:CR=1 FL=1